MTGPPSTPPSGEVEPLLSVVAISYNQDAFVRDALEGFLTQEVDFPIEIIVADDASTDATASIIAAFAADHPGLIRPILRPVNVGVQANLVGALQETRGRYVALCEGDDYWTDVHKLSRQVGYLEAHPETAVCFHPVRVVHTDDSEPDVVFPSEDVATDSLTLDGLLGTNFIQTNSVVYRRLPSYDTVPLDILPLDWYLHVLHALTGSITMLPQVMSVYRRHPGGIWWESESTRSAFWLTHGPAQARMCEAVIHLLDGDPRGREALLDFSGLIAAHLLDLPADSGLRMDEVIRASPAWAEQAMRRYRTSLHDVEGQLADSTAIGFERFDTINELQRQLAAQTEKLSRARSRIRRQATRLERLTTDLDSAQATLDRGPMRRIARGVRRVSSRRQGETSD